MEGVHDAVIVYISDDAKWVIERTFDGDIRLEYHRYDRITGSWACTHWTTFDAATWSKIVAAMADTAATEVIPHG